MLTIPRSFKRFEMVLIFSPHTMLASWSWLSFAALVLSICVWFVPPDMVDLLWVSTEVKWYNQNCLSQYRSLPKRIVSPGMRSFQKSCIATTVLYINHQDTHHSRLCLAELQNCLLIYIRSFVDSSCGLLNAPVLTVSRVLLCQHIGLGHAR